MVVYQSANVCLEFWKLGMKKKTQEK